MRDVKIYNISDKIECISGPYRDFLEFVHTNPDDLIHCSEYNEVIQPLSYIKLTAPIHHIRHRTPCGHIQDEFICIDPKDREKLLMMVEGTELTRLERSVFWLETKLDKQTKKLNKLMNANVFIRIKWLFTGVNSSDVE